MEKGYDKLNRKDGEESLRKFVEKENIMQKILITNDDGIQSDGIIRLAQADKKYGKVWVVAPDGQRSAMSHRITLHETIEFFRLIFRWRVCTRMQVQEHRRIVCVLEF